MQSWLENGYAISYDARMSGRDRKQLRKLAKLHGEHVEISFMSMLIEHRTEATEEAEEGINRAFHDSGRIARASPLFEFHAKFLRDLQQGANRNRLRCDLMRSPGTVQAD